MARGQMQEVLLVEVVDDRDPRGPVRADGAPVSPSRRLGGAARRWWPVAAVLAALLAVGVAVTGLRERERLARLEAQPRLLAALGPPFAELWRTSMRGWGRVLAVDGDVVLFGPDADGATAVVRQAGESGARRWLAPFPELGAGDDLWCQPLGADGAVEHLACRLEISPGGLGRAGGAVRLVVLDAGTGERVAERALTGTAVAVAAAGVDLVVSQARRDGTVLITRQDPVTAAVRWSHRTRQSDRGALGSRALDTRVEHGVVVVGGPVTWALDVRDGRQLGEWHLEGGDWAVRGGWGLDVTVLADGRFAVGESGGVGLADEEYGTVSATDARDGFAINGPVLQPVVDDGSAADLLFTVPPDRGGMIAQDAATGERRWDLGTMPWGNSIVLDGRVIVVIGRELVALDARSGQRLWSVPVPRGNHAQQVVTDGDVVAVPISDRERGPLLAAFDPADGRARWTAALPPGGTHLTALDGRLAVFTDRDLVVLG
ncbi:outer membrane protein assembly factor BamB family protein [Pengzhenrongella sicca]|uniref:PQQ-binding-like beta-propeller repeat protein n=1 Tax=Pengzhenrongella sicca TaxID=2819238 RepID=A0A8A4ZAN2_9MICO|nr:PQQ-binding-like beta-propeller repeat protein [Pengzhenrongella sicca]QTE28471.1 PQQ-binding-like beta-propeller repeat protein [Pengzhenrongella sicca]